MNDDVEEGPLNPGLAQPIDQLGMLSPRPWPTSDLAQGSIIDSDEDDVSARLVRMNLVAGDTEHVLGHLAELDQPKDECSHCRPQQKLPSGLLTLLCLAPGHRADFLQNLSSACAAERLSNRKP